jgi:hypothetical protein
VNSATDCRTVGRYIGDRYVEVARRLHVDDIVPGEQYTDITGLCELPQGFRGQPGLGGQHDFSVVCALYDLAVCGAVKDLHLTKCAQPLPTQVARIQRVTIENDYFDESHNPLPYLSV